MYKNEKTKPEVEDSRLRGIATSQVERDGKNSPLNQKNDWFWNDNA